MLRDDCATPGCGHGKDAHYREVTSSRDVNGMSTRKVEYFACLASFCTCDGYQKPEFKPDE